MKKLPVIYDMESNDPDDAFTLCLLASHPAVKLKAITISPGSPHQVGLVRHLLDRLDHETTPIGVYKPDYEKVCVSGFHYKWLGKIGTDKYDGLGGEILDAFTSNPDLVIITGGPLGNVENLLKIDEKFGLGKPSFRLNKMVIQGGFAGDSIVPPEYRLEKFAGKETCPTFNFNANINAAKAVLASKVFKKRFLVSKNVCHGLAYDEDLHKYVGEFKNNYPGLSLIHQGMGIYLKKKPKGKLFHDPLAACVAINQNICEFKQVEIYRQKGEWGSKLSNNSNTFISINVNRELFKETLVAK
jgi:pyrimidine-specific ribonucleoside hydrolase